MNTTVTVSTSAELKTALSRATGGETILLNEGNYGYFGLGSKSGFNINFPSTVTIASADPQRRAVFTQLDLSGASNLTIKDVTFDYTYTPGQSSDYIHNKITSSSNITITGSIFNGDLASGADAASNGFGTAVGLNLRGSRGITLTDNEFFDWKRGITVGTSSDLVIARNDIHDLRSDEMTFASVQNVKIVDNHIHNFRASYDSTDHRDMIQFWTTGTTKPTTNVEISGNKLDIGNGSYTQSIFMRNEMVDSGQAGEPMFYRNILIENNEIYNGHIHGITVGASAGLTIRNNSVIAVPDQNNPDRSAEPVWVPAINVAGIGTDVVIERNAVAAINGPSGQATWQVQSNALIQNSCEFKPGNYSSVFIASSMDCSDGEHNFVAMPGCAIETLGAGAPATRLASAHASDDAFFHVTENSVNGAARIFDAGMTAQVLGVADNTADYRWDFGDGTSASGKIVSHVYTGPGNYDVKLTVVLGNGTTRTADADVGVHGEVLVAFNDTTGAFQSYLLGETRTLTPLAAVEDGALQIERTGTAASIPRWVLKDLRGSDDFDINFTVKGDAPGGSGEIFRQHGSFLATMTSAGQLSFQVFTNDGLTNKLLTTGLALNDGQAHDIQLQFRDGDVQIWTDGVLNVQRTMTGSLATTLESDIVFGNPWGKANFVSDISAFEVRAHVGDYADTPMTTVLVDDNVQGTGMHDDGWTGRVFDFASFAGSSKYLLDNARVEVDSDGDDQVVLDGDKDYVNLGRQVAYEKSDRVGFSVDFARDEADGSVDRLIWNHMKVGLTLQGDGVSVQVATKDQGFKSYAASNIGLNDTDRHRAEVMVDTVDDRVQVVVDGEVVIDVEDADFELEGAGGREAGWMIGTPWNRYFDGTVYDFRLGESYQFIEDMDEPEAMPGQVLN